MRVSGWDNHNRIMGNFCKSLITIQSLVFIIYIITRYGYDYIACISSAACKDYIPIAICVVAVRIYISILIYIAMAARYPTPP